MSLFMIPVGKLFLIVFSPMAAFTLWKFLRFVHNESTSPLRKLRGPKPSSWIFGSMREIRNSGDTRIHGQWIKEYGTTMTYKIYFFTNRLLTIDTRAIKHVLTHSNDYQKPDYLRYDLALLFSKGLLFVEGAQHRQQRHIMNPAFGLAQIRALTQIFVDKSVQLLDVLSSEIAKRPAGDSAGVRIDVVPWLNRMGLDVIGLAGFNYNFGALNANEKPNELSEAFAVMVAVIQKEGILPVLRAWFPPLRLLTSERIRRIQDAQHIMVRIGKGLLSDAKAAARASMTEKGEIEKSSLYGRDVLSLLVKANMATDLPENLKMSDEDVLAQVPTFLTAGHRTTSTATTWALYAMSLAPEVQTKLREELLSLDTENPSMDELMALPYLDAVVKETLRVYPPVSNSLRVAMKDDVLPVEKPYQDKYGNMHDSIKINKGDEVAIPILEMNHSKELWGSDAHEFRPERWENQIPGVWAHLLTFLGGNRACIGYRFTLVQMKTLLFTLVRAFEFELAVPASEIDKSKMGLAHPVLRGDPEERAQLPLLLKHYKRAE